MHCNCFPILIQLIFFSFLIPTIFFPLPNVFAASATQWLDFKEYAQIALSNSPTIKIAENQLELVRFKEQDSFVNFLPKLSFNSTLGANNLISFGTDGSLGSSSNRAPLTNILGFSLSENLYNNGQNLIRWKKSQIEVELAQKLLETEKNNLLLELWRLYFDFCKLTLQWELLKKQEHFWQQQFNLVEKQYKQGLKLQADYLRTKAEFSRTQIDLLSITNQLLNSQNKIRVAASFPQSVDTNMFEEDSYATSSASKNIAPLPILKVTALPEKWASEKLIWSKTLKAQIQNLRQQIQSNNVASSFRNWLPQLNINANLGYNNYDFLGLGQNRFAPIGSANINAFNASTSNINWNFGISISWDIWDWKTSYRQYLAEKINTKNLFWEQVREQQSAINYWNNLISRLQQLAAEYSLQQDLVAIESSSFNQIEQQYKKGEASYLDVQTAARNNYAAQARKQQLFFDYKVQMYDYFFWKNTIYEKTFNE